LRTFQQFDPKVSGILLFRAKHGSEQEIASSVHKAVLGREGVKLEQSNREGWTVIEVTKDLSPDNQRFSSISPDLYKVRSDELKSIITRTKEGLSSYLADGSKITVVNLFTCGTKDSAWLRNYSDVTFLYKDGSGFETGMENISGETYQSNIAYLNRVMNLQGKVLVNNIKHGGVGGNVYLLGYRPEQSNQHDLMIELDMSTLRTVEAYQHPWIVVKGINTYGKDNECDPEPCLRMHNYLITLLGIKSKLIDLLLLSAQMEVMILREVGSLTAKGNSLLDEIFALQNAINDHMKTYGPGGASERKREKGRDKVVYVTEKSLLTKASVHFSMVSEVENAILRISGRMMDLEERMMERSSSLSMQYDPRSTEESRLTLGDVNLKRIEQEKRSLSSVSEELIHSRVILTSTIEVLRTFIDTRQREISEDTNKLMNVIFLVLAVFGLADALGNFVVVILQYGYLQGEPSMGDVWVVTLIGMALTLVPLLISAGLLYYYLQNR